MSSYTGDIVKDGLVLCLDAGNRKSFVSGSTTWVDLSANRKNGTLTNGPTFISSNGGTIAFDGSNDYVNVSGFNVNHGTGNFSYSCWAYLTGKPSLGTIFENGSWTNCILIRYESNGITIYSMNGYYGKFTFNPDLNTWNHLTFVRSGNSILFYLNGEFSASTGFGTNLNVNPSPANLFIGVSQHALNQCFNGRLNNLLVYNRALSAAEIRENYNATKGRYDTTRSSDAIKPALSTSGLIYNLDAANYRSYVSGSSTWRDLSINRYNGTLTNGPTYSTEVGGAIVFDGTNDYVTSANAIKIADQNRLVTVEVGFYLDSTSTHGNLVSNRRETNEIGQGICRCGTGSVLFELNSNTNLPYVYRVSGSANAVSRLRVNDWNIVSWGLNIGTTSMNCNFMVNGYTENTSTSLTWFGSNPSTQDDIEICRWANHIYETAYTKSRISFVRIYNRQLSASEQLSNYDVFKGRLGFVR